MDRYTLRYQVTDRRGHRGLIVENDARVAFIFSGGLLQASVAAPGGDDAAARLAALLARSKAVVATPPTAAYGIAGLCGLLDTPDDCAVGAA